MHSSEIKSHISLKSLWFGLYIGWTLLCPVLLVLYICWALLCLTFWFYIYIGALLCLGFIHLLGVEYLVHKGGKYTILHDMQIEHNPSMMLIYKEQHKGNHVSICIFIN